MIVTLKRAAITGFIGGFLLAAVLDVKAQGLPGAPKGLEAEHVAFRAEVGAGISLFKFNRPGGACTKGELAVAIANSNTQQVIFGCSHPWGGIDYILFADGDIGGIATSKWIPMGRGL